MTEHFDLAVIGGGIAGLAHATVAARLGKRVAVIERNGMALGASIRNFGFVTVTGQASGQTWARAVRSRDIWAVIASRAKIAVDQRGLLLLLRRAQSRAVAEAFLTTPMGRGCRLLSGAALQAACPQLPLGADAAALFSPHELRVESRLAIPQLAAWLAQTQGVRFFYDTAAHGIDPPRIETSRGPLRAEAAIICPGDDFATLFPERIAAYGVRKCRLSMLRLANPGFRLPAALMSDLGLVRYRGYADLPEAKALAARLQDEQPAHLAHGVHLIVVQSADGSLVVGDSHHYGAALEPFAAAETEALILDEFGAATGLAPPSVLERWTGVYATAPDHLMFADAPGPAVRLVMVTSGTGASTAFAIAEDVVSELYGVEARAL